MLKRILNNPTIMSWSAQFTRFGSIVLVTPLILVNYDLVEQSFWWLIGNIIGFALLADSGFGSAVVRAVSYFRAGETALPRTREEYDSRQQIVNTEPNIEKLRDLLATTRPIYFILGALSILLLLAGTFIFRNIFTMSGDRIDFWVTYFLLVPTCYLMIMTIRWSSFMQGLNEIAREARVSTLIEVVRIILFTVLLSFKLSPMYLVITMFFASLARYIYVHTFITKWFRERNYEIRGFKVFNREIFGSLWAQTWRLAGIFWGNYMVEYGNTFLMAQIKDAKLMACFLFTTNIMTWITGFSRTPFYANVPTIYKLGAEKNFKELRLKATHYMFMGFVILISAYLFIGLAGNPLLSFLDNHNIMDTDTRFVGTLLFTIMALSQMFEMHATFHSGIYTSTNHIPFLIPSLVSGLAIVVIGYNILPVYGLFGLILTRFLVQLSFNSWYSMSLSLKLLNWPFKRYLVEFPSEGMRFLLGKLKNLKVR
jgi:O-antigen/teichoic acid export membrane protein